MEEILTVRQVQELLKVDRITVYRMLQDGRLKGSKIGQQWRFNHSEIEGLLAGNSPDSDAAGNRDQNFPTHCVQTIQDLFSEVSQIGAVVISADGEALTQVSRPTEFYTLIQGTPAGQMACQLCWKTIAQQAATGSKFFTCFAGLQYIAAPIQDENTLIGFFLAGQFYWQAPDAREESERIRRLATSFTLPVEALQKAARSLQVIQPERQGLVENWPTTAARAVQSILHERVGFMNRLQRIADLTQLS